MGVYQASFRIRHECPYRGLSERYPDLTIREWYLNDCQVLEVTSDQTPRENVLREIETLGDILHMNRHDAGLHIVMQSCLCPIEGSVIERFEEHNCLYQPPTVHRQGWEHYTVISFDEAHLRALRRDLAADREIELLAKTGLEETRLPHSMLAPVDRLFDSLTERQLSAVRHALDNGYYEQPRRVSIDELASETSVARSTYEEHLRKAENKLMQNIGQFLRLKMGDASADSLITGMVQEPAPSD